MSSIRVPPRSYARVQSLSAGARVALVAPAGPLGTPAELERALDNVRTFGWEPVPGAHVSARRGYLAGSDAERLADLNRALRDDAVDAVWCVRGGYGVMRLLDGVAYDALRRRPKPIIGYSDVTALHAAVGRHCQIVTVHGPTARSVITPFSRNSFERALCFGEDPCGTAHGARTLRVGPSGVARGRLAGGNLAVLTALVGTPYFPDLHGALLVLEDVHEAVYRVDRMLRQLLLSGALAHVTALAFGACTACPAGGDDAPPAHHEGDDSRDPVDADRRALDDVLREIADCLDVPCVSGLPIGHIDEQWTLPLGARATLDAEALTLTVEM